MTTFQTWQLGTFLMCWHLGKLLAPADAVCLLVLPDCWAFSKPCGQKIAKYEYCCCCSAILLPQNNGHKVNMFINASTYKPDTELIEQCGGAYKLQERCFWVVLDVTKKVTVLIFAIFCPRGLEGGRQSGPRGGGSRAAKQKRGRRLSCVPVLGRYSFPAAEFTPLRRTASCTGRRRSRPGRAVRRVCPSRRCRRRGSPRSRRRYGSWTGGAR